MQAWDRSPAKKEEKAQKGEKIINLLYLFTGWKSENEGIPPKGGQISSLPYDMMGLFSLISKLLRFIKNFIEHLTKKYNFYHLCQWWQQ